MPDGGEFAHPAGIIFVTKDKIVSRYLSGVIFDPKDFKLALLEASEGTVGKVSLSDKVLLYCYDFDPVGKKYALKALNVMKLGGAITLISLIILMIFLWTKKQGGSK
jgi:protein SCO1/2